ncbi:hypothetical protein ILUMI_06011 [Ignelater luminosus]|uniref:ATP synthase subunit s-like protein n=1 Tax=Ignelater luminosus TaxID=2038154 RepID=A0A8K0GHM4_IGNLU|nr:hypothetical protein ILUMI_06011 [Ignelater luminosus]
MLHSDKLFRTVTPRSLQKTFQICFCSTKVNDKPENAENSKLAKEMPKDLTKETDIRTKVELTKMITKKDLQWRTPWHEKEGQHYSFLRSMYSEESNTSMMKFLQTPINLSPAAIKKWWAKKQEFKDIWMQQYIPERNETLGNELAAAHFVVHRDGAVKFFGEDRWIKKNEYNQYSLPKHYQADKVLQAIDCSRMNLYYEGLVNLRNLHQLEWFSINGCQHMDDWCMDRISNIFSESLLYLDVRDCPKITERGIGALYKMKKLKILYVDDILCSSAFELTCLMLQDINPDLDIRIQ